VLFWGAVVWLIVWGISRTTGSHRTDDEPLEIARKRYARGDITRDQFEQLQRDLR
jgi:putative membrane protein